MMSIRLLCHVAVAAACLFATHSVQAQPAGQKKPPRVLLVAGSATQEFRYVRALFAKQMKDKKAELSIWLQNTKGSDTKDDADGNILSHFPGAVSQLTKKGRYYSLDDIDLVIAFDADWSRLTARQAELLQVWVRRSGGGLVLIAGPDNTYRLAGRGAGTAAARVRDMCPVILHDSRLHFGAKKKISRPHALNVLSKPSWLSFKFKNKQSSRLWNESIWGEANPKITVDSKPKRGFYDYYPVQSVRPEAEVGATLLTKELRINQGRRELPYIAWQKYNNGHVVYLGGGEFWRLRAYSAEFYDQFWLQLAIFATGGRRDLSIGLKEIVVSGQPTESETMRVFVRLYTSAGELPPRSAKATLSLIPPKEAQAKPTVMELQPLGDEKYWAGWFGVECPTKLPGLHRVEVVHGTTKPEKLSHFVQVQSLFAKASTQQQIQGKIYREILIQMLNLADSLKKSPRPQDQKLAEVYQGLLKDLTKKVLSVQNEKFLRQLRDDTPSVADIKQAIQLSQALGKEYQILAKLLDTPKYLDTMPKEEQRRIQSLTEGSRHLYDGQRRQTLYLERYHKRKLADLLGSLGDLE